MDPAGTTDGGVVDDHVFEVHAPFARTRFDADTALTPLDEGRYSGHVSTNWDITPGLPNGGYLLAFAARAGVLELLPDHPHPVGTDTTFLHAGVSDAAAVVEVEVLRRGGRHATVMLRLIQEDVERIRVLATYADLTRAHGDTIVLREPPDLPRVEDCLSSEALAQIDGPSAGMLESFVFHTPREDVGWMHGVAKGTGVTRYWLQFADDRHFDPLSLLLAVDAFPPGVFDLGVPVGWAPTVTLHTQVRGVPTSGPLRAKVTTTALTSGYHEEDVELWDSAGNLVALSRQLALAPRPRR